MIPNPLHPAVVHFPIVLVILLPIFVGAALWLIHRGANTMRAWSVPVAMAALLALSTFVAQRTGAAEEERVESVVSEAALHEHEEAAERLLLLTGVVLLFAAAGFTRGALGKSARLLTAVGSVGLIVAGVQVGKAGGELVYRHNAASVYAEQAGTAAPSRQIDAD